MRPGSRKLVAAAAGTITTLAVVGCTIPAALPSQGSSGHRAAAISGRVVSLNSISTLKALFNRANGHARLVLIFSPT